MLSPDDLARALDAHERLDIPALPGRTNHLRAGVLVPVVWEPEPTALLTLRSRGLNEHAGEVSFPGGKPEDGDDGLEATALREAREELGIDEARVLGRLSSMPVYTSNHRLEPFVAAVPPGPLHPEPGEVAAVLRASIPGILGGEAIDAIPWEWQGTTWHSPVFTLDGRVTFGATAQTLLELLVVCASAMNTPLPPFRTGRFSWEELLRGKV